MGDSVAQILQVPAVKIATAPGKLSLTASPEVVDAGRSKKGWSFCFAILLQTSWE